MSNLARSVTLIFAMSMLKFVFILKYKKLSFNPLYDGLSCSPDVEAIRPASTVGRTMTITGCTTLQRGLAEGGLSLDRGRKAQDGQQARNGE